MMVIYYFYQNRFSFSGFLDIKTIITASGTLFGAYFGAKIAGKYAIESAEKQIENNNKQTERSNHDMFLKLSFRHLHSSNFTIEILTMIENAFEERPTSKNYDGLIELIDGLVRRINIFQGEMEKIETSNLTYEFYNYLNKTEILIEITGKDLMRLSDFLKKNLSKRSLESINIDIFKTNLKHLKNVNTDLIKLTEQSKRIINENTI